MRIERWSVGVWGLTIGWLFAGACGGEAPVSAVTEAVRQASDGARSYGSLALGMFHTCALGRAGAVFCGGYNAEGQLGDGTTTERNVPVQVSGLSGAVYVAAGVEHSCAVNAAGGVSCWGWNNDGQLGNGGSANASTPQTVRLASGAALGGIVEVAAGYEHTCARDYGGNVYCWGDNTYYQLTNTVAQTGTNVAVRVSSNSLALAAGGFHTCALQSNNTVSCWGYNGFGEIGDGLTNVTAVVPTTVSGLSNATAISATAYGTCARIADGTEMCWGRGDSGELGNGTSTSAQNTPVNVRTPDNSANLTNVQSISAGGYLFHNCAIVGGGAAYCWGDNAYGDLGDGTTTLRNLPVAIGATGGTQPNVIAAGAYQTCARTADGNLWCWGFNAYGQLGNNTTTNSSSPVFNYIPAWTSPRQRIAASEEDTACAITSATGVAYCWGNGASGALGNGTLTATQSTPVAVSGLSNLVAIAGNGAFDALRGDGTVWCWGDAGFGQCGNGPIGSGRGPGQTNPITTPVQVPGIANAVAITEGCAVLANGSLWCWGANDYGQTGIGNNTYIAEPTPIAVPGLTDTVAVTGEETRCALRADGTVWCWGRGAEGEMGNGTTPYIQYTPVQASISNVVAISGMSHMCALRGNGTVWCWGLNSDGQLGDGTTTNRSTPVQVGGITNAVAVTTTLEQLVSFANTCAVLVDGTMRCWGGNQRGQLGIGTAGSTPQTTPVTVSGISNALGVAIAGWSIYALKADGTLWSWGDNAYGELGLGTVGGTYYTPTELTLRP